MQKIKTLANAAIKKINDHAESVGNPYKVFGIFGTIAYPLFYLFWVAANAGGYESLTLRLVATFLCILLILKDKWPKKLIKFFPLYWYLTLLYCLPFLFTFTVLKNNFSFAVSINGLSVLVLLILLLDLIALLIILSIGIILGFAAYKFTGGQVNIPSNYLVLLISYSSVIVVGALFARSKQVLQEEKLQAISGVASSIAHELRTPLATLRNSAKNIKRCLPPLIETYKQAKEENFPVKPISFHAFSALEKTTDFMESETEAANTFIDMLLMNVNPTLDEKIETFSISECVNETLSRYPFTAEQKKKQIVCFKNHNDFLIRGKKELIVHVLFNLIKNALFYIAKASKGKIEIWLELGDVYNKLFFQDTGTGIPNEILPYIFDRFFTRTRHGAGIGLAFCKMVTESVNGKITCESAYGDYTKFILNFPKVVE